MPERPERRRHQRRQHEDDPLRQLVSTAVGAALDKRWKAMLTASAIAALIACLVVSLPVTLILSSETSAAASHNSATICKLTAQGRPYGNARAFALRLALGIEDQTLRRFVPGYERETAKMLDREWQHELAAVRTAGRLPAGLPAHLRSFDDVDALAPDLALINCSRALK